MFRRFRGFAGCIIVALALSVTFFVSAAVSQDFQKVPIVLSASELLPKELLTGTNYTVRNVVMNDGLINTYEIDTSYGLLKVESTALLLKRIAELKAISQIEQLKGTDVYGNAFKQAATAPLQTAEGLITDPSGTISAVGSGIGRFFSGIGQSVTSNDPYQPSATKSLLGQAAYKRQFAYQFGVDPYSSYAPFQKELDDLSWTAAAGGLTVKVAMMAIPGAAGTLVGMGGTAQSLKALVSEKTPGELETINRSKLSSMGVPDYSAQNFLTNFTYDPQEKTLLVGALANMASVMRPAIYIDKAAAANEESVALFMRVRAQLMEIYYKKKGLLTSFIDANGTPLVLSADGKVIGIFPFDYLAWTAGLAKTESAISAAIQQLPNITGKELWITGKVDAIAREALEKRGWKVEDNIQDRILREVSQ